MTLRTSPLDDAHRALHAKMVPFGGWDMPLSYPDGTLAEHKACRHGAVAFDVSHLGTVRVEGPDALHQLQQALHQRPRPASPPVGPSTPTCSTRPTPRCSTTSSSGGSTPESFDVMPNASNTDRVTEALSGGDDTTVVDVTPTRAIIAVQGPEARARLADGVSRGRRRRAVPRGAGALGDAPTCVVAGTGYTGEDGVELAVPVEAAVAVVDRPARGRHHPGRPRRPRHACGSRPACRCTATSWARASRSLQAGLGWVVRWDKGDFRGRDALLAEKEAGRRPAPPGPGRRGSQAARGPSRSCCATVRRSASSPAATSRRSWATASPWRSCRPTSRSATTWPSTCGAPRCRPRS